VKAKKFGITYVLAAVASADAIAGAPPAVAADPTTVSTLVSTLSTRGGNGGPQPTHVLPQDPGIAGTDPYLPAGTDPLVPDGVWTP
jgi:hypothetical protein